MFLEPCSRASQYLGRFLYIYSGYPLQPDREKKRRDFFLVRDGGRDTAKSEKNPKNGLC
jgi:hypothetical protein